LEAAEGSLAARTERPPWLWLAVVLCLGTWLRLRSLGEGSMFIDEGESSLNALSILEHGYPADRYLGLPMFENTLTAPWPESAEYEFRDTSYSSRGMAVYHGWLPLYAIAGSLWLHGIRPDALLDPPRVQHDEAGIRRRIRAARLPAVLFGTLFVAAIFLAGRALYGADAGLAAALMAALAPSCVWLAQQARYYSAALALSTLAAGLAWTCSCRGRWRDFVACAIVFALLFHTSSLSFAIALLSCAVLLPGALRRQRGWAKLAAWAGIVVAGIVPWMLWTGYPETLARIPMARAQLDFPGDYLLHARGRMASTLASTLFVVAVASLWFARRRLPRRLGELVGAAGPPVLFLALWVVAAYFGFQALVPSASCSMTRLSHVLIAATILLASLGIALLARALLPRHSTLVSAGCALALLAATGSLFERKRRNPHETRAVFEVVEYLRNQRLSRDTLLFALPTQHFCLTYYTGLPVQTIAPVRREFLDRHPGEILLLETVHRLPPPRADWVQRLAAEEGVVLDRAGAEAWIPALHGEMIRVEVTPLVREFRPEPGPRPGWFAPVVAGLLGEARRSGHGRFDFALDNPAMFSDLPPMTMDEFWPAFFYRFVGPEGRSGAHVNYACRMRDAGALLLSSSWIALRCPARVVDPR
jgi:hypothetical protein